MAALKDYGEYQGWDHNRDGYVRAHELSSQIYKLADQDDDGLLNIEEWSRYARSWYDPFQARQQYFDAYDANKDGYLQESEFYVSVTDAGIFTAWDYDGNGSVDPDEWDAGIQTHRRRSGDRDKEKEIIITGDE